MILLQIDGQCIAFAEFESDAPRPVHMQSITHRCETSESVKVKPRNVQALEGLRAVQNVKPPQAACVEVLLNAGRSACLEELPKALVSETPDHRTDCNRMVGNCQLFGDRKGPADLFPKT